MRKESGVYWISNLQRRVTHLDRILNYLFPLGQIRPAFASLLLVMFYLCEYQ